MIALSSTYESYDLWANLKWEQLLSLKDDWRVYLSRREFMKYVIKQFLLDEPIISSFIQTAYLSRAAYHPLICFISWKKS